MSRRSLVVVVFCALIAVWFTATKAAWPQAASGQIHGTVMDQSGALIASATVVLTGADGSSESTTTSATGGYRFNGLAAGSYQLSVSANGFAAASTAKIAVATGRIVLQNVTLQIAVAEQQVEVNEQSVGVSTVADNNASAIVISGKDLNALSDDPDELQSELTALAGPSAGPNGAQIYIDGFTGGQLPPKSSIREIRVNQNPFSAQYDRLGYGRVEILTKPGTDTLHGSLMMNGNDSAFNSLNPFVTNEPPYYGTFMVGNVGGSLNSKTSWFVSLFRREDATNSIINAEEWNATTQAPYNYTAAVATPSSRLDFSPRFDFQLGDKNTLTVRYMLDRQIQTNSGVSGFSLQSQGFNQTSYGNSLQLSDSQVISANVVNETRLQYMRNTSSTTPLSTDPTILVQGAFNGGGSSNGVSQDHANEIEVDNYTTIAAKAHAIQFGGRLRLNHEVNLSTAGFNGTYIYPTLTAYANNQPEQYTVTTGNPVARLSTYDVGIFFQDDYKYSPNLTLSYGLRYEMQNWISDHNDWAPRLSMAWAPGGSKSKTVIRAGYGWFFDRFQANNVLTTLRDNGVNQRQTITQYTASAGSTPAPVLYELAPNLRAALNMQTALGVEHQWGKVATTSVTYVNSRGVHEFMSNDVNAYQNYNPTTGTGTRPNGINEDIYQFQSGGIYRQNQLMVSYSVQAKRLSLFGFYSLTFANADTSGANYFPSNPYDIAADYGRANFDVRNRLMFGGNITGPYGITFNPMFDASSGSPYNITLSQDLAGDGQMNDRPALATSSSTNTMETPWGNLDLSPSANEKPIPYNFGTGPSMMGLNMRISKSFAVGPRTEGRGVAGGFGGPGGGPGGGGPPGGGRGGMGSGLGPGGLSGNHGMPGMGQQTVSRRYSLNFAAMGRNVLNTVNLGPPNAVLPTVAAQASPLLGKSTSLAGGPFGSAASNRSIDLQVSFNF